MHGIVISGVGIHIEGCSRGDGGVVVFYVLDAGARETDGDDGEESQDFADEGGYVGDFFFVDAGGPGVAVGVDLLDFRVGEGLDFLAMGGGEIGYSHY